MVKKIITILLCASLFSTTVFADTATNIDHSSFVWNDTTKDDALTVFETTDWSDYQRHLIYKEEAIGTAKANVSDEVSRLEDDVKKELTSETLSINGILENYKEDYTQLILCMIQILGEEAGVTGKAKHKIFGDIAFNSWVTNQMGQMVLPGYPTGKENSIRAVIDAYSLSVKQYIELKKKKAEKDTNKGDADISEPYLFSNDEALQAVIQGAFMHYGTSDLSSHIFSSSFASEYENYSVKKAGEYYRLHKEDMKSYFGSVSGYLPNKNMAERVSAIYSVSTGLGENMTGYLGSSGSRGSTSGGVGYIGTQAPNERVAAFLNELQKHNGKPYVYGSGGPDSFDCSHLICYCLEKSGAYPNFGYRTSQGIHDTLKKIPYSEVRPGDILWHPGHVMVFIKEGYTFEAMDRKHGVGFFKRNTATQTVLRWY